MHFHVLTCCADILRNCTENVTIVVLLESITFMWWRSSMFFFFHTKWLHNKITCFRLIYWLLKSVDEYYMSIVYFNSCGLVMPYGDIDFGQYWQQDITWTIIGFSLMRFCGIHQRAISQCVPKLLFCILIVKTIHINGFVQERRNSIADALELHLSCTNPSIYGNYCHISLRPQLACVIAQVMASNLTAPRQYSQIRHPGTYFNKILLNI